MYPVALYTHRQWKKAIYWTDFFLCFSLQRFFFPSVLAKKSGTYHLRSKDGLLYSEVIKRAKQDFSWIQLSNLLMRIVSAICMTKRKKENMGVDNPLMIPVPLGTSTEVKYNPTVPGAFIFLAAKSFVLKMKEFINSFWASWKIAPLKTEASAFYI